MPLQQESTMSGIGTINMFYFMISMKRMMIFIIDLRAFGTKLLNLHLLCFYTRLLQFWLHLILNGQNIWNISILYSFWYICCAVSVKYSIQSQGKQKNKIIQTLLHDSGIFYRLFYNFLYLYSLVLLNICFVLSNIKDFIPKKFHIPIYLSIFFFVLGLLVTTGADTFYESNIIWRYWFNKRSKLNYIKLAIQIVLNFCLEIPTLIILWILSSNDFDEEDDTASSMISYASLLEDWSYKLYIIVVNLN